jgi:predicted  nucleic acid-binding Zn-ribbon protein
MDPKQFEKLYRRKESLANDVDKVKSQINAQLPREAIEHENAIARLNEVTFILSNEIDDRQKKLDRAQKRLQEYEKKRDQFGPETEEVQQLKANLTSLERDHAVVATKIKVSFWKKYKVQ